MIRREFLQGIVSILVTPRALLAQQEAPKPALPPPAPVPWTLGLNPKTPLPHTSVADAIAGTDQRFFTAQQMATLTKLSDVLLPPLEGKPGALDAGAPLFLDFLIGTSPAPRQKLYTEGLDWLNSEAQAKYKKPFADLDATQIDPLLKPWLRTWMSDHPPTELHASFVNIAHSDIRAATVNSKPWIDAALSSDSERRPSEGLYWYPIEPDMRAANADCVRTPPRVIAAPRATHTIPSYPR